MTMEYDSNNWIWNGVYNFSHLFGGLMLTAALLGFSTSYFGGVGVAQLPYLWFDLEIFQKKKREKKCDAVRTEPKFLDAEGHAFGKLRYCSGNDQDMLLQDIETFDRDTPTEKWSVCAPEQKQDIEKGGKGLLEVI